MLHRIATLAFLSLSVSSTAFAQNPGWWATRCESYYTHMTNAADRMEQANRDMEEAYNSGDIEGYVDAAGDYNEARGYFSAAETLYVDNGCPKVRPVPDAPPMWEPA